MSYEIIIKKTCSVRQVRGKEWTVIGQREVPREERFTTNPNEPKTRIEDVRGYTPEVEKTEIQTVEIFKQVVDDLNLGEVIKAVNGI